MAGEVFDNPTGWVAAHIRRYVGQVRSETSAAIARPATASERPRLWDLMVGVFPKYATDEQTAGRPLPVVLLERR